MMARRRLALNERLPRVQLVYLTRSLDYPRHAMFVQRGLLPTALEPEDYWSDSCLADERKTIFAGGWHLVATRAQLLCDGAFVATDIAGLPILVRNQGGSLHAFVNVCAHRHSMLEGPGCGIRDALRCRYHGWEYDCEGRVAKLPDGASFKGLKTTGVGLRKLRASTFGPFVYVGLGANDPDLSDWLGALADELRPFYDRPLEPLLVASSVHEVNWKIIVENAVESYHVPLVHPRTFRYYRDPSLHDHRLESTFTRYADLEPWSSSAVGRTIELFARIALRAPDRQRFRHAHRFPNMLYYYGDLYCDVSVVNPLGPKRSRYTRFAFLAADLRFGDALRPAMKLFGAALRRQDRRIFGEDRGVWSAVQAGVEHAQQPGVLSAREERVWAFQSWLAASIGRGTAVNQAEPATPAPDAPTTERSHQRAP